MWATCAETIAFVTFGDSKGPISRRGDGAPGGLKIDADLVVDTHCILNIEGSLIWSSAFLSPSAGSPALILGPPPGGEHGLSRRGHVAMANARNSPCHRECRTKQTQASNDKQ